MVCPPEFEHLTKCPKLVCAVSPQLILKHLISSVVTIAQLVSPSVPLPAELVWSFCHNGDTGIGNFNVEQSLDAKVDFNTYKHFL